MKLLLHSCCAPCSTFCIKSLREEGIEPTLYFYNPNIHPYMEYKARRDCLKKYAKTLGIKLIIEEEYGLDEFCAKVSGRLDTRCEDYCYPKRMERVVQYGLAHGYDHFSTTLLISPYQKHEKLKAICESFAGLGIDFLYRDFRIGFEESRKMATEAGLYLQKYCGCIFSEEERFARRIKHDGAWART